MHLNSNDIPHVLHLELQLFPLCKSWVSGSLSSLIGMPNSDYAPINVLVMSNYGTIIVYTGVFWLTGSGEVRRSRWTAHWTTSVPSWEDPHLCSHGWQGERERRDGKKRRESEGKQLEDKEEVLKLVQQIDVSTVWMCWYVCELGGGGGTERYKWL